MKLSEAKEQAKEILDLREELNKAIVKGYEMGLFINIVVTEREAVVAQIHPHPCPKLNMGVATDPLDLEE